MSPASALQTGRFLWGEGECTEVGMESVSIHRKELAQGKAPLRKISRQQGIDQGTRGNTKTDTYPSEVSIMRIPLGNAWG